MIPVRDVWRGVLPPGTDLIAGGAGLDRRVEWATALRTRPPAFDAIKGGELAFVPVRSIRLLDDRLDLAQVMASLGEKGGVAVAIVGDASTEAIAVADRMMLPLFRLPPGSAIPDVLQTTVRYILDQRTHLHETESALRSELTELALAGADIPAILDRMVAMAGGGATWRDDSGAVVHRSGALEVDEREPGIDELQRWLAGSSLSASDPPVREFTTPSGLVVVAPIPQRGGAGGYLTVSATRQTIATATVAVARAAAAAAIPIDRERAVLAARDDLEGDIVGVLVTGAFASAEAIVERSRRLGLSVEGWNIVAVIDGVDADLASATARTWAKSRGLEALVAEHAGRTCVIAAVPDERGADAISALRALVTGLRQESPSRRIGAGIGRPHSGPGGVRNSYAEAVQAAAMGARLPTSSGAVAFAEMGLHRLLFAVATHPELRAFEEETLARLRAHDRRGEGGLIATTEAYFICNGSPTAMAHHLGVHRNTVLYRLRRIAEVAGVDFDDPVMRLRLHLALRVGDVLDRRDWEAALPRGRSVDSAPS